MLLRASRCVGSARRLGRAPSTLSREVARNGGRHRYRAHRADRAAWQRARRRRACKLASNHTLRAVVEELLAERWSPQQIAGWLARTYPGDEEMRVSHETIYLTLFIQARGGLKRELTQHLRTRRANRRPKGARPPSGKGQIVDPVMISRASRCGGGPGRARALGRRPDHGETPDRDRDPWWNAGPAT